MSFLLPLLLAAAPACAAPARRKPAPKAPAPPALSTAAVSADDRRRGLMFVDTLIEDSNYGEAEAFISKHKDVYPPALDWLLRLARIRSAQGDYGSSAAIYRQLLAANDKDAGLLLELGINATASGDFTTAEEALLKAKALSSDPLVPYSLSDLAFIRGDDKAGRAWAEAALKAFPKKDAPGAARRKLHLRARLGFDDSVDQGFAALSRESPADPDILLEWASVLLRERLPDAALEPLSLFHERFPDRGAQWADLEAARLRLDGKDAAARALLVDALRRWPADAGLAFAAGEAELKARRCAEAERYLLRAASAPAFKASAEVLLEDVHRLCDHQLGPVARWRQSMGSRILEEGLAYRGYPRPSLRVEAEASDAHFSRPGAAFRRSLAGLTASAARDGEFWTLGGDLDLRAGSGVSAASPGLFVRRHPPGAWTLTAEASARRQWADSAEAVAAGVKADSLRLAAGGNPLRRLRLAGQVRAERLTERGGGSGHETYLVPEAVWTLLDHPFHMGLGYRFVVQDAGGQDAFFAAFPILRRSRTHYASLDASKRWLGGRLLTDATVFNGHDDGRGARFFSGDLLGMGLSADWRLGPVRLLAGFSLTRDAVGGIAGHSQAANLSLQWRWDP